MLSHQQAIWPRDFTIECSRGVAPACRNHSPKTCEYSVAKDIKSEIRPAVHRLVTNIANTVLHQWCRHLAQMPFRCDRTAVAFVWVRGWVGGSTAILKQQHRIPWTESIISHLYIISELYIIETARVRVAITIALRKTKDGNWDRSVCKQTSNQNRL